MSSPKVYSLEYTDEEWDEKFCNGDGKQIKYVRCIAITDYEHKCGVETSGRNKFCNEHLGYIVKKRKIG